MSDNKEWSHFQGKDAMQHIVETQAQGMLASSEIHGAEMRGSLFAGADSARETAVIFLLIFLFVKHFELRSNHIGLLLTAFSLGWLAWKSGRSAWLAWSGLERLHRVVEEERLEIQNNRAQEREELKALYQAKGFQGRLLDDVVDVLMADGDRLMRVMLEEEMGYRLQEYEHPLQQAIGSGLGVIFSAGSCLLLYQTFGDYGLMVGALSNVIVASVLFAQRQKNRVISAVIWNLSLVLLAYSLTHYLIQFFIVE